MPYAAYGVSLTDGQKQSLAAAVHAGRAVTLRVSHPQFPGPDRLMLTATQVNKIGRAKAAGRGVDLRLSKTQLCKKGGFGPFAGSMLAGIAAPIIGKMLGFGQDGRGLQLPGTGRGLQLPGTSVPITGRGLHLPGTGRGLQLPGTRRRRGKKKELRNSLGPSSSLEMRPLSNFDIENILKGITNFRGVHSKDMLPKRIGEDESVVINIQDYLDGGGTH